MDPRTRLTRGQTAARKGRFADALREYIWFHEHALEHDRAYYGVRLSFALSYWMELARSYPEAKRALEAIRDRKSALLAAGEGNRSLFHDVESLNKELGADRSTYELFLEMLKTAPALAADCADIALDAIIKAQDFALAAKFSASPEDALLRFSDDLNGDVADLGSKSKENVHRLLDAFIHIYCSRAKSTIAILEGLGKSEEVRHAREWAVALVESKSVRARVGQVLNDVHDA